MPNFNFSFRSFEKLLTFDMWRERWVQISKILRFWLQNRIPHDDSSLNAKFWLFIQSLWEVMNIWHVTSKLGSNFENFTILTAESNSPRRKCSNCQISTCHFPHDESAQIAKFQLVIRFLWEVMDIWPFWGYFGSPGDLVTSQMGPKFEKFTILTPSSNSPRRK